MHRTGSYLQIGCAFFGLFLIGLQVGVWGVVLPSLVLSYHIDQTILGLFFVADTVGYFLGASSYGAQLARWDLRRVFAGNALLYALGALMLGVKPPLIMAVGAQLLIGFSLGGLETGFSSFLAKLPHHTMLLNLLYTCSGVGSLVGPPVAATILAARWEWRGVYLMLCGLGLALLLSSSLAFRTPAQRVSVEISQQQPAGRMFFTILTHDRIWMIALFMTVYYGVMGGLSNWMYSFLLEDRHQPVFFSSGIASGYWLSLTLSRFLFSWLSKQFQVGQVLWVYGSLGGIALCVCFIWIWSGGMGAAIGFCLMGICMGPLSPTVFSFVPHLVPKHMVSSAFGLILAMSMVGFAPLPWLAGILIQHVGFSSFLPYLLLLIILMLGLWGGIHLRTRRLVLVKSE